MADTQQEQAGEKREQNTSASDLISAGRNLLGMKKSGSRVAAQAGRLAAQAGLRLGTLLFTTPVGWAILGIGFVFIIVFVVVFRFGPGAPQTVNDQTINPTPTEIITPTPAGP